jgi:pyruvate dehydrogenase complex dihydrolipoamide acetyltransferase long form
MSIDFKLPELGENIASGDVVNVLVREGDQIVGNQPVIELETDKAVVEIPCPHAGKISRVHVAKGDRVSVGQTIVSVDAEATSPAAPASAAAPARPSPPPKDEGKMQPTAFAAVAARPRPSPLPKGEGTSAPPAAAPTVASAAPASVLPAGPLSRRLARELGVDLARVQGTGQRGRITPEDVQAAAATAPAAGAPALVEPVVPPGELGSDPWGPVRRERMSQIRRTIAAHMAHSARTAAHLTNFDDADITELEQLRKGVPQGYFGPNLKLTTMPLILKAVALALTRHPMLNASLDEENGQIIYKQYVNLGVAVDTPRGLVVPVIRSADRLSIAAMAQALAEVAEKARAARFTLEEIRGGTFTVSNLGAVGGTYSTPIINHPEVAILLVGRARRMPVIREGQVEPRFMLPLSLSYDHRLVDGATAARFLNEVIAYLQSPGRLLLAG